MSRHLGTAGRRRTIGGTAAAGALLAAVAAGAPVPAARAAEGAPATRASAGSLAVTSVRAAWTGGAAVRAGRTIGAAGTTSSPGGSVRVDRLVAGRWRPVASTAVTSGRAWRLAFRAPSTPSWQSYRAVRISGGTARASSRLPALDVYRMNTYRVATRGRVTADVSAFAASAARTYADPRGWRRAHQRFRRVTTGGDFTLYLAESSTMPSFSPVCSARYSCRAGRNVVVNQTPWLHGTPYFTGDLLTYRRMVVDHETGHWLGLGHRTCPAAGAPAPVMMQQSKGLRGCRPNAWPLASEVAAATR